MSKNELLSKFAEKRNRCGNFTRVMGYIKPVCNYNESKAQEFHDRTLFEETKIKSSSK